MKHLKQLNVLYAEDNQQIRQSEAANFAILFNKVYTASNGEEALQVFYEEALDLAILDIEMPCFNGIEVAKVIRKENRTFPIVFLSAYSDKEYLLSAIEVKAEKYFIKPLNIMEMVEYLNTLFSEILKIQLSEGVTYDTEKQMLFVRGDRVLLGEKEKQTLELLLKHESQVVTKEEISKTLYSGTMSDTAYRNLIRNLRAKIGKGTVRTIPGIGAVLECQ